MEANSRKKTFAKYAAEKFQSFHSKNAERTPLKQSLHHFKRTLDQNAARAISLAIFRYTTEREQPQSLFLNKPIFRELINHLKRGSVDGGYNPYVFIQRWNTTDLEIIHFICGLGILGPQLRDEIFCQIYKQINGNYSVKAQRACWTLFACCLSSFPPSNEFHPYMINILNSAPEVESGYCRDKLERTLLHGKRNEPPSSYEYEAILKRASIKIAVHLPNTQKCTLSLDSATTGLELKRQIKSAKGIVDIFGFAFYVSFEKLMLVIVSGDDHVMDVISSCEQRAKGMQIAGSCKLGLFKEIFSPWHNYASDKISTELIYNQIITSIKSGDFKIRENGILEKIIAVHCYLLHGVNVSRKQIEQVTRSFHFSITRNSSTKHKRGWVELVEKCFRKIYNTDNRPIYTTYDLGFDADKIGTNEIWTIYFGSPNFLNLSPVRTKPKIEHIFKQMKLKFREREQVNRVTAAGQVVQYAKVNLTAEFSRSFRCTSLDVDSEVSFEVNCLGVGLKSRNSNLWKILFSEMKKVTLEKFKNEKVRTVVIHTIYQKQKQIKANKGDQIHELLNFFLTGLRKRSRYLLAVRDRSHSDTKNAGLEFYAGDLIVLDKTCNGETLETTGRGHGTCQRTGLRGDVSGGIFYIIPIIEPPHDSFLAALRKSELKHQQGLKPNQLDNVSVSSGLLPQMKQKDNISDDASSRIQVWVESNTVLPTHEVVHPDFNVNGISPEPKPIIANSSSEQLRRYTDTYDTRNTFTEQRNKMLVINSRIDVTKRSYQELESELFRSKTYVSSTSVKKTHEKLPSVDQEEDLRSENEFNVHGSPPDQGVPDIAIWSQKSQVSEKDITIETGFITGHERVSAVTEDHVSVSLEHDTPQKNEEVDGNTLHENHEDHEVDHEEDNEKNYEEDHFTEEEETTKNSYRKVIDWNPERFGFPSFEESDSYKAIISYVEEPACDIMSEMKLTDAIFGRPLGNSVSEDHVYLEIIKHIDGGENDTCADRSWELMWLITGLYSCSDNIKDEVIKFLRARTENNVLAKQCYMRLVKMITHGRRTYPPHIAEVQAIQTRMDLINHKVFFPDGSCQSFEVESSTTARHLISVITENIGLRYPSGCGLFFKIGDKVFGAADEYFFFDFIQHFIEVWRRTEGGDGIAMNYQVFFLRKVWINVIPGEDRVADCRLHYYQELSKYLRGYHKCTEAESILLATLILRAEFGEDTEHLSEIPDMLNKLVPHEMIPLKTVDEWQQVIEQALSENVTSFGDDAKIEFLKEVCKRSTFGTAFFSVKTKMIDDRQEALLLAVQKNGLAFFDATDKTIIERYDFSQVEKWASGDKKITIDVKVNEERKKLEFETSLDYQIDDFLTSYISAYGSESQDASDDI